jgi:predicted HD phosphohydrolase
MEQAEAFIAQPGAHDAVSLRRWDDEAKVPGLATPGLAHYAEIMRVCRLPVTA